MESLPMELPTFWVLFSVDYPTATYSQNVGIVTTTKVINRWVLGLAAAFLGIAGFVPKFSALLTTIPQCVLGGATVSVFASIAMTGMKLVASAEWITLESSIVGLAAALGVGVSQANAALATLPAWVTTIFGNPSGSCNTHCSLSEPDFTKVTG